VRFRSIAVTVFSTSDSPTKECHVTQSNSEVFIEYPQDGVAMVRIHRPEARNALNMSVRQLLATSFEELQTNPAVRCVVLTGGDGANDNFAAGADLKEMAEMGTCEMVLRNTQQFWSKIEMFSKPLIAAVHGFALGGGCELAMFADIIVASESAQFGQPEVKVGIMPGAGGTQRLVRAIGKYAAMKMLFSGEPITASEARQLGLVSEVVSNGEVISSSLKMAQKIARMPPLALQMIKESVRLGQDLPLESALALERKSFQILFDTHDQKEGMAAFLEKRRANFLGK
jgi:enoyl-CoA hydratase